MKYRIKKKGNDAIGYIYTPQYKLFFCWVNWENYEDDCVSAIKFISLEEAERYIRNEIAEQISTEAIVTTYIDFK